MHVCDKCNAKATVLFSDGPSPCKCGGIYKSFNSTIQRLWDESDEKK